MIRRRPLVAAVLVCGAFLAGCAADEAQVTESNANHPARGFGSFEEPQNDTVEPVGRVGRSY